MNLSKAESYSVFGGGAWGTALANLLCNNNLNSLLFTRDNNIAHDINNIHKNQKYLGDITLNSKLKATNNLNEAFTYSTKYVLAIPAQQLRDFLTQNLQYINKNAILILCAKGIEENSGLFMSQIIQELLPKNQFAILSGPSFAEEVALSLPTAVTIACQNIDTAQQLAKDFSSCKFRCYSNFDIIGVQIGGALKNVFAIACGALVGKGFGESAKAALITRAFAEMRRIGIKLGANPETLCGLSGLGDLMLSCNSIKSRNFALGYAIGTDTKMEKKLTEGYYTAHIAAQICDELNIEAPLIQATYELIYNKNNIATICDDLLRRPLKIED